MSRFFDWLDHRTGYRPLVQAALYEHVPGGARWRYVWGSALSFAFFVQLVTGVILWAAYSPSAQTAWESVYYVQHQMTGGWLLRGVHHFMAHAMVVLLAIHFVQIVIDGAYRAPREVNFWIGLVLMQIVLAMALTGYLLPWDQKGYWATKVATNMLALVPLVGEPLQRLVVGGSEYGHHTLTRFFALHAGVLPGLLMLFLALHLALFRRHGLKAREPHRGPDATFWPHQLLRDGVACLAVTIVVLVLALQSHPPSEGDGAAAVRGAPLGAPADPAESYSAARPELYFLFLFQLLKYLEAFPPVVGAVLVPGLVLLSLFVMPFVGRWELGHRFNVVWTMALLAGAIVLTALAWREDHSASDAHSERYLAAVAAADTQAERAAALAGSPAGIPQAGALAMLRQDPKTQGPKLFRQHCAACHSHAAPEGSQPADASQHIAVEEPTASNLWRFGRREWIAGILDPQRIAGPEYLGNTALADGDMVTWVRDTIAPELEDLEGDELAEYRRKLEDVAIALAAEAQFPGEPLQEDRVAAGQEIIVNELFCTECHKLGDEGELGAAPDLTGYASREWLRVFIANPEHERFYPDTNDRMPAFAAGDDPAAHRLSAEELDLLVLWLRGEWFEPTATAPPAGEPPAP